MRVIVNLSASSKEARQQAVTRLKKRGFRQGPRQDELVELGMIVGDLADHEVKGLRAEIAAGKIPGVDSLSLDEQRSVPKPLGKKSTT